MTQSNEKKAAKKAEKKPKKLTPIQELNNQVRVLQFQIHQMNENFSKSLNAIGAMAEYSMNCFQVITDYTMGVRNEAAQKQEIENAAKDAAMKAFRAQSPDAKEKKSFEQLYSEIKPRLIAAAEAKNKPKPTSPPTKDKPSKEN